MCDSAVMSFPMMAKVPSESSRISGQASSETQEKEAWAFPRRRTNVGNVIIKAMGEVHPLKDRRLGNVNG